MIMIHNLDNYKKKKKYSYLKIEKFTGFSSETLTSTLHRTENPVVH